MLACQLAAQLSLSALEMSNIHIGGLGTPRTFSRGYYIEVSIAGQVAIKTKTADYDPVNKVYRIRGVWSIRGGKTITPEHQKIKLHRIEKESSVWWCHHTDSSCLPPDFPPKPWRRFGSPE